MKELQDTLEACIVQFHANKNVRISISNIQQLLNNLKLLKHPNILKTTHFKILCEALYNNIKSNFSQSNPFYKLRSKLWKNHFGVPTLTFLLTHNQIINKISHLIQVEMADISEVISLLYTVVPDQLTQDLSNGVLIDQKSISSIKAPTEKEKTGQLLKTYNPTGGFTTTPCDEYSIEFLDLISRMKNSTVLEIGAGFGAATLEAIARGAKVFCNDVDLLNLSVVGRRYISEFEEQNSVSGDFSKLILVPGDICNDLISLPKNSFDAILACRVIHFLPGTQIQELIKVLASLLKPGGKLFIICETPYLGNWKKFISIYETRVKNGVEWPGEINNPSAMEDSGRSKTLPNFVHWITKEVLERTIMNTESLNINRCTYINRKDQFPEDLLLDGHESIGLIASKLGN